MNHGTKCACEYLPLVLVIVPTVFRGRLDDAARGDEGAQIRERKRASLEAREVDERALNGGVGSSFLIPSSTLPPAEPTLL